MRSALLIAIYLLAVPATANPQLLANIRPNETVTIALPRAECDAKVVRRDADQLTLLLKRTTPCGARKSLVTLARADVDNVIDERPRGSRTDPLQTGAGRCTVLGWVVVMASAGQLIGETKGEAAGWAVIAGGAVTSAVVCHAIFPRGPRYSVFASKVTPLPAAKVP